MTVRFDQRMRTAAQLTTLNPTVPRGDIVMESDTGKVKRGDGQTAWASLPYWRTGYGPLYNASVTTPGAGFASDTYLVGSSIAIPLGFLQAKSLYRCVFNVVKTAAGTATPIIITRFGTAGTTADTALTTLTFSAQTAAIDEGTFELMSTFRTVGAGTEAVLATVGQLRHGLSVTGLGTLVSETEVAVSSGFNSTPSGSIIGLSVNGGASAAWTITMVRAELVNPA
jgi:hypothetical protein